jgi:hypothetical protein
MTERRIGLIPNAADASGSRCGVFVTDRRTFVVRDEAPRSMREELRSTLKEETDRPASRLRSIDFATFDIESLARLDGIESVPHTSILKLAVGKGVGGYGIWMEYSKADGKKDYLIVTLVPPKQLIQKRKAEGIAAKDARRQYALRSQEVFKRALPPIISEKVDWRI